MSGLKRPKQLENLGLDFGFEFLSFGFSGLENREVLRFMFRVSEFGFREYDAGFQVWCLVSGAWCFALERMWHI